MSRGTYYYSDSLFSSSEWTNNIVNWEVLMLSTTNQKLLWGNGYCIIEERTVDCLAGATAADCVLKAPEAAKERKSEDYKCRWAVESSNLLYENFIRNILFFSEEPMPQWEFNELARNSTTRIACPIGCEPDADLSVCHMILSRTSTHNNESSKTQCTCF